MSLGCHQEHPVLVEHPLAISFLRSVSHGLKSSQIPSVLNPPDTSPQVPHKERSPQTNPSPTFTSNTGSSDIESLRQATELTFVACYSSNIKPIAVVAVVVQHHAGGSHTSCYLLLLLLRVKHHCHSHWSNAAPGPEG